MILFVAVILTLQTSCGKDFLKQEPSYATTRETITSFGAGQALLVGVNRDRFASDGNTHQFAYGEYSAIGIMEYMGEDFISLPDDANYGSMWAMGRNLHCENNNAIMTVQPWNKFYRMISTLNQLLAAIDYEQIDALPQQIDYLRAQALAYRAHFFHMLVRMYAQAYSQMPDEPGIVLYTEEDLPKVGLPQPKARATVRASYAKIEADLLEAERLMQLPGVAAHATNIKFLRLNTIRGILSRVYLDKHDFAKAAEYANVARGTLSLMSRAEFGNGFYTRNAEWMWASFVPSDEANSFATHPAELTNVSSMYPGAWGFANCIGATLLAHTDPVNDARIAGLVGTTTWWSGRPSAAATLMYDKFRWTMGTPYDLVYMRAAEMLLNEAEALCMPGTQQDFGKAKTLVKTLIAARINQETADLVDAMTNDEVLNEIKMQRRLEFWGEGHRFFDLKRRGEKLDRTGNGTASTFGMTRIVDNPKSKYWVWLIPLREMNNNTQLRQNNYDY